jgi:hypothetical protein
LINTSNEYKRLIRRNRVFIPKANLDLYDSTSIELEPSDIMQGGIKIDDSVGEKVSLGTAIINKCTTTLNNFSGKFDSYDFSGSLIRPYIGLQLSAGIEYLPKGVFTANKPTVVGSIIVLESLDNMARFDTKFSEVPVSFPSTALHLLQSVCLHCGVSLSTASFLNSAYVIENPPDDESISCREIVSWVAQIAGCFARCNTLGALELKWFNFEAFENASGYNGGKFDGDTPYSSGDNLDGGNFTNYLSGDSVSGGTFTETKQYHHLYSFSGEPTFGTDDIYITGIQVTDSSDDPTAVLFGSTGYVLPITGNKLIQNASQAEVIANSVGQKIVGMMFRSFSGNAQSDPSMEAGDIGYASTRKGNSYPVLFTRLSFTLGGSEPVSCGAETFAQANYRPTQEMKAIIESRKIAKKEVSYYDLAQQTFNNLVFHSMGIYRTVEEQPDGSKIEYSHDKPTLAESQNIWKQTAGVFAVSNDGGHTWRGIDADGNIMATVLNTIGVNADWIRTGKLLSNDGATLIDMAFGVANTDNISFTDNIQNGFPLTMPFNIDDTVSKITKVLLKFTQQKFRTYSTTASSGGGSTTTASSGGGSTTTSSSEAVGISVLSVPINIGGTTSGASSTTMSHSHTYATTVEHSHPVNIPSHSHSVSVPSHTHGVTTPDHTHTLNFGVQETDITNNVIDIYVDGFLAAVSTDLQGVIDLTSYVTTVGWHTIEIRTAVLKRVSAQINIKSYIRS